VANWLEMSIRVPAEYVEPVAALFQRYGEGGVVIEEPGGFNPDEGEQPPSPSTPTLRTYLPNTPDSQPNREMIHIGISLFGHLHSLPSLQVREVQQAEWESAWKAHFPLLHVSKHLVITAPFHEYQQRKDEVVITVDPGMAFGTGHHPTTRRCLLSIERLITPGARVLDVGSGSGILAIAAAKLGAGTVVALETDEVAYRVGADNVRANGVESRVRCHHASLPYTEAPTGSADLVLANISAKALAELAPALRDALKTDGWLVAAGILQERPGNVEQAFAAAGLAVRETFVDDDWVTLLAQCEEKIK